MADGWRPDRVALRQGLTDVAWQFTASSFIDLEGMLNGCRQSAIHWMTIVLRNAVASVCSDRREGVAMDGDGCYQNPSDELSIC
jgi:hypothetical protein